MKLRPAMSRAEVFNTHAISVNNSLSDISVGSGPSPRNSLIKEVMQRNGRPFRSVMGHNSSLSNSSLRNLNFTLPNMTNLKYPQKSGKVPWGIEGYKIPVTLFSPSLQNQKGKFCKSKLTSFIDDVVKSKQYLPPVGKYNIIKNISSQTKAVAVVGSNRNMSTPAPIRHSSPIKTKSLIVKQKMKLGIIGKEEKRFGFFDEAVCDGQNRYLVYINICI